ncbi:MAG TPA: hypothetical protein VFR08_06550 [Candidatus Angelobacter sp.]|nr:hypothetical protein [Candidatus Angelobacter sp.]
MTARPVNLLVFREGRRDVCVRDLKAHLVDQLRRSEMQASFEQTVRLLLLAGELECGVADVIACGRPQSGALGLESGLKAITDTLAMALLGGGPDFSALSETLQALVPAQIVPEHISISAPEGFAYYALHPLAYAGLVDKLPGLSSTVAVVGIRSIGTTLSAVVAAALRRQGKNAGRITVRPHGHPYNRELRFSAAELQFVRSSIISGAGFLVIDEGPGLSGSSFLAVAEALVRAGVALEKITLICGHQPNFETFRSEDGAARAKKFRWQPVDRSPRLPEGAGNFLGGGEWRRFLLPDQAAWPASWTSFERLKYGSLDAGSPRFYKFLGLGHYGDSVFIREQKIAEAGFGPEPKHESHGFASYQWIQGRTMRPVDLSDSVLDRLAQYCAFRATSFPAELHDLNALQLMADHNLRELGFDVSVQLEFQRPVIADGRMQPHEWLLSGNGKMLKTDSGSHGDDHFFPGLTDVAWDLAGAIVEWEMNPEQSAMFLDLYRQKSGDDASSRIQHFIVAYSVFRAAYCLMAANALGEGDESRRFLAAAEKYKLYVSNPERGEGSLPPRSLQIACTAK